MKSHLALLRAVNVGGTGKLPMADLRTWLEKFGFTDVRTVMQSGNVVFRGGTGTGAQLERRLETASQKDLGLATQFFIRTSAEWSEVIARNPFRAEAASDPSHLVLVVLKAAPTSAQAEALAVAIKGPERTHVDGRHAYITYPEDIGHSKLTLPVIEKHLGTRGTARNWNTVLKLEAAAEA